MFSPAPSSKLLNLTGFFSSFGLGTVVPICAAVDDMMAGILDARVAAGKGALTKGGGCFFANDAVDE